MEVKLVALLRNYERQTRQKVSLPIIETVQLLRIQPVGSEEIESHMRLTTLNWG